MYFDVTDIQLAVNHFLRTYVAGANASDDPFSDLLKTIGIVAAALLARPLAVATCRASSASWNLSKSVARRAFGSQAPSEIVQAVLSKLAPDRKPLRADYLRGMLDAPGLSIRLADEAGASPRLTSVLVQGEYEINHELTKMERRLILNATMHHLNAARDRDQAARKALILDSLVSSGGKVVSS